jgi:hypothetical protein
METINLLKFIGKYKGLSFIFVLIIITTIVGCKDKDDKQPKHDNNKSLVINKKTHEKYVGKINKSKVYLISGDEAIDILANEDDYTIKLSKFDFSAKFKSAKSLNVEERRVEYRKDVIEWDEKNEERIKRTTNEINKLLINKSINLPNKITLIFTRGYVEADSSYTRGTSIIFPTGMIEENSDGKLLNLYVHELFHVYSRYNINKRPDIYKIIGYKKCQELLVPSEIKDLTIANPDAPDNNYYGTFKYKGNIVNFIPIIYSKKEYNANEKKSFFEYLKDDMLAVKIENGKPIPMSENGKLIIVTKDELPDYYNIVGHNTSYTYHPEETMADNFVFLVKGVKVKDQWIVDKLGKVIFNTPKIK